MGCKYKFCKYDATKFIIGLDSAIIEVNLLDFLKYFPNYLRYFNTDCTIKLIASIKTVVTIGRFCFRHNLTTVGTEYKTA